MIEEKRNKRKEANIWYVNRKWKYFKINKIPNFVPTRIIGTPGA